jgi:hypothetical protein
MTAIFFVISMLLPAAAGYMLLYREKSFDVSEKAVLSLSLGVGLLSFYLFLLGIAGLPFSFFSVLPFFVPFVAFGLRKQREIRASLERPPSKVFSGLSGGMKVMVFCLLALVLWKIIYIVFIVFSAPTIFWDAYTLWNYKAKVIFFGNFQELFSGEYRHYPLHVPLVRAWTAHLTGGWNDAFANLYSVVLFICLLSLVFHTLKRQTGAGSAMIFTFILSAIPVLVYNTMSGYADIVVAYYFFAATVMLYHWHRTGRNSLLVMTGILLSTAMFAKNEGIAIALPAIAAAFVFSLFRSGRSWKHAAVAVGFFAASLVLIIAWLVRANALSSILEISGLGQGLPSFRDEGLRPLFAHLFLYGNYNLFWAGLLSVFAFRWKRVVSSGAIFFLVPSAVAFIIILYVYLFTGNVEWLVKGTAINRTMLLVLPLLTVSAGLMVGGEAPAGGSAGDDGRSSE